MRPNLSTILAFGIAFIGLGAAACAPDPADTVPAAVVEEQAAVDVEQPEVMEEEHSDEDTSENSEASDDMAGDDMDSESHSDGMITLDATVGFVGSKITGSHNCVFKIASGGLDMGDGSPASAAMNFEVVTDSVVCDEGNQGPFHEKLHKHLRSEDFFSVDEFPTASFVSTSIVEAGEEGATHAVTGDMTIKGIVSQITFPATVMIDEGSITGSAEFSVNRRNWELNYDGSPDDLIREDVVMMIELSGAL